LLISLHKIALQTRGRMIVFKYGNLNLRDNPLSLGDIVNKYPHLDLRDNPMSPGDIVNQYPRLALRDNPMSPCNIVCKYPHSNFSQPYEHG